MSDDLSKKIKQITDILGQDSLPDNVKGLLSLLTSSSGKEEPQTKAMESGDHEDRSSKSELEDNIDMIRRVTKMMDKMKNNNDPRINLLTAIKPYMGSKRQKRLNSCIKMLQMSSLTRMLDENDKGIF